MPKFLFAGLAAALIVAFAGVGLPGIASSAPDVSRSISVTGSGAVTVVPDRAVFAFGVDSRGKTATDALAANAAAMTRVIAALRAAGVDPKDIQTQEVSLSPISNDDDTAVIGYESSNTVAVTVHSLAGAGALIDRAVAAGANQIDGPALNREDADALYRKALESAIADARAKAETIAAASGLTLGRATQVSETSEAPTPASDLKTLAGTGSPSTPVEAGTSSLVANVSVTFEAS